MAAAPIPMQPDDLARIALLSSCAYFLDADGTLIGIMARPVDVAAEESLKALLAGAAHGALGLVSGRAIMDIDHIFAPHIFFVAGLSCGARRQLVAGLKQAHHDKGKGIAALLATPPFLGRKPVFIGDDLTDESGFRFGNAKAGFRCE